MNEIRELVTNYMISRVNLYTNEFVAKPGFIGRKTDLIEVIETLHFIASIDDGEFEEANFEACPIGEIEIKIKQILRDSKEQA